MKPENFANCFGFTFVISLVKFRFETIQYAAPATKKFTNYRRFNDDERKLRFVMFGIWKAMKNFQEVAEMACVYLKLQAYSIRYNDTQLRTLAIASDSHPCSSSST